MKNLFCMLLAVIVCASGFRLLASGSLLPFPRSYVKGVGSVDRPSVVDERDASIPSEGYRLEVTAGGARIFSSDARGAFYARETLRQLTDTDGRVACCVIKDHPKFPYRILMLDESRHFFGKAFVLQTLELMARYKFNKLHWHLTDDQGWRIAIDRYPELTGIGATRVETAVRGRYAGEYDGQKYGPFFYTKADIREIVRRATELQIDIIPEIEMPGHCRSVVASYPDLACPTAKLGRRTCWTDWGITDDCICASNPKVLEFYRNVIDEVCDLFPGEYIHVGGDEVTGVQWQACPLCQAKVKELGLSSTMGLQGWYTMQIYDYLVNVKHRKMTGYMGILENGTKFDPKSVYLSGGCFSAHLEAARQGYFAVAGPAEYTYWDFNQGLPDADRVVYGSWWSGAVTLSSVYGFDPCRGLYGDLRKYILGGAGYNWSEYTYSVSELEWKIWPRAIALAQALWNPQDGYSYKERFLPVVKRHIAALRAEGVNCADAYEEYAAASTGGADSSNQVLSRERDYSADPAFVREFRAGTIKIAKQKIAEGNPSFISTGGGFNGLFVWDSAFAVLWARHAADEGLPITGGLDALYDHQREDGFICREYSKDGKPCWKPEHPWAFNPPILSWAEVELVRSRVTTVERVKRIYPKLVKFHQSYEKYLKRADGLYCSDSFGCGMDDIPRMPPDMTPEVWKQGGVPAAPDVIDEHCREHYWKWLSTSWKIERHWWNRQAGWIDMSSQMAFDCLNLAELARMIGREDEAERWMSRHADLAVRINELCWNEEKGFYFDRVDDGQSPRYTVAAFWTLLAKIPSARQVERMVAALHDPKLFETKVPVTSLAVSDPGYRNGYWVGSSWPPTTYMVIRGLKNYGLDREAEAVARKWYNANAEIWVKEKTVREFVRSQSGEGGGGKDFCGWSALVSVALPVEMGWL